MATKDRNGVSSPYCQVRLGRQKQTTKVIPKTISPAWHAEFIFPIVSSQIESTLLVTVWDKDMFKSDFLGFVEFHISDLLQMDYEDPGNESRWYPLNSRNPKEYVSGDICIQIGVIGFMEKEMKQITQSLLQSSYREHRRASLISTDDPSDLIFFNHITDVTDPDENDFANTVSSHDLGSEESIAKNIPHDTLASVSLLSIEEDLAGLMLIEIMGARNLPFERSTLKASFNCDPFVVVSFGTKTFRTKIKRRTLNPDWYESIYLHLKKKDLKSDWPITFTIYDFERFTRNNEICSVDCKIDQLIDSCEKPIRIQNKPIVYPSNIMEIDLKCKNTKSTMEISNSVPYLILNYSFIPYVEIRRNFWLSLLSQYEISNSPESEPKIDKVSLVTMLDAIECNFSDETINNMFASVRKKPTEELTFSEAIEILEAKIKTNLHHHDSTHFEFEEERMIQIKNCPLCRKGFDRRGDFDMVSHIALCSHGNLEKLDQLAMGGFLTQESASSKWVTKIFSYVTFGGMGIGKTNGHILYQDRVTGQLVKEKIPTYIRLGIRLLYQVAGSKSTVESKAIKKLLKNMTLKQGAKFESPSSVKHISQFIAYHNLDLDEVLEPLENFKTFNEFFYRKLKPGARTLASPDPRILVCPADARTHCFPTIKQSQDLWIKGTHFTLESFLGDAELANIFQDGSLAIFRLAPQDYHRFHFPVDGTIRSIKHFEGSYFTVNPMAVRSTVDVYIENTRVVTIIDSEHHGKVAYVAIGAMLVGSTIITGQVGAKYKRMDEMGYFAFGGSTIVLLLEKDRVEFDSDLIANSATSLETLCKMGNSLGRAKIKDNLN